MVLVAVMSEGQRRKMYGIEGNGMGTGKGNGNDFEMGLMLWVM